MTSKEWKKVKVDKLGIIKTGKTPKTNKKENYGGNIPFLTPTDNMEAKRVARTIKTLSSIGLEEVKNCLIPQNSICVSCIGSDLGKVVITSEPTVTNQQINSIIIDNKICNADFIYYSMLQLGKILNYHSKTSTAVPIINKTQFSNYEILLPPLETQEKIARVLSSLDDKIELNNKINKNLEQQAQAIFKSWFVDFEPFGGKMPDDWKKSNLLEIANYLNGLAMQKYRPKDNEPCLPVLKIKELRQGFCDNSSDVCTGNINNAYIINNGDIIFSWSGSLLVDIWCGGKCGLNQHLFKVTSEKYDKWFYYFWTKHYLSKFIALASDMATTMGHIKREELEKSEVIIPNKEEYQKINSIMSPILNLIINNKIQNKQLAQLRDTLLPMLMSGEIDVDKVEV